MDTLQSQMDNVLSNPVTYGVLAIFLAMYGPRLHPKLPKPVKDLFGAPLFRFAVIVLVIYMSTKDLSMALVISIAFLIVMSIANSQDMEEEFMNRYKEGYSNFDAIKEFYDDEEPEFFQEGPESYDNNEEVFEEQPEEFNLTTENGNKQESEHFTNYKEAFKCGDHGEEKEGFEGGFSSNYKETCTRIYLDEDGKERKTEQFTPYERHLHSVVNKYKFGN